MGILSGIISYFIGLVANLMDIAISAFLGALSFDLDTFESYFPAVSSYYEIFIGFAVGLLLIMLVFQLFRNFGVMLDMEAEDPLKMLGKTVLFFGMIMYSRSIVNYIVNLLTDPYSIFLNAYSQPFSFDFLDMLQNMIAGVATTTFMSIVYIILLIVLGWQFLKFVVEIVERYIAFFIILCFAPVVFATGAFKSTSQIFKSWCRMLGSQAMLLLLNVWSIKLFISFLVVFSGVHGNDIIFFFLIGYGFLKQAQKADTMLRILGLNTASAGDVVRSLGGTIGGIAHALQSASNIAGRAFGGKGGFGSSRNGANNNGGSGGNGNNGGGNAGGMGSPGGNGGQSPSGQSGQSPAGGVTETVTGTAKQQYANDVLASAKAQINGTKNADTAGADESVNESFSNAAHDNGSFAENAAGNVPRDNVGINQGSTEPSGRGARQGGIDADTKEGLANIAHGLPHDKYDPVKKKFSGGGFSEFTGENANIIGASQLTPADGFRQSTMKMSDGSLGTVYKNDETGEAHVVQFGSVDNGVMQGCISAVNQETGKLGDRMAFKAVHESVPGAESFSSHSVKVADSEGGVYHVSSGADTSFFASGSSPVQGSAHSSFTPGSSSAMPGAGSGGIPSGSTRATGNPGAPVSGSASGSFSDYTAGSISAMPDVGVPPWVPSAPAGSPVATDSGVSVQGAGLPHDSGSSVAGISPQASDSPIPAGQGISAPSSNPAQDGVNIASVQSQAAPSSGGTGGVGETVTHNSYVTHDAGTIHTAGSPEAAQPASRRFSKNNPAYMEVFKRETGNMESFSRGQQDNSVNIQNISKDK